MAAVASTVRKVHIRERLLRRNIGCVDAVAEQVVRRDIEARAQNSTDDNPLNYIDNIIGEAAAVGIAGRIARNQTQTLTLS